MSGAILSSALAFSASSASATVTSMVPPYGHIVVVVEENHGYNEIIGSSQAPYINLLVEGGALLTNYHAITHPSEPNYFAMYAGSTFGVRDDNPHSERDPSLYTILHGSGLSFLGYVEPGDTDFDHEPWEQFPEGTTVERNFTEWFPQGDFPALPSVSFVIPNLNRDMHNGTIAQGDRWLESNLGPYAQWAATNNSLLIVTFDENGGSPGNRVATVLYGTKIASGTVQDNYYDHFSLLSTILAAFNLTGPRHAATAEHFAVFQP